MDRIMRIYVWFLKACLAIAAGFVLWLVVETLQAADAGPQGLQAPGDRHMRRVQAPQVSVLSTMDLAHAGARETWPDRICTDYGNAVEFA